MIAIFGNLVKKQKAAKPVWGAARTERIGQELARSISLAKALHEVLRK